MGTNTLEVLRDGSQYIFKLDSKIFSASFEYYLNNKKIELNTEYVIDHIPTISYYRNVRRLVDIVRCVPELQPISLTEYVDFVSKYGSNPDTIDDPEMAIKASLYRQFYELKYIDVKELIGNIEVSVFEYNRIDSPYVIPLRHLGIIESPFLKYDRKKFFIDKIKELSIGENFLFIDAKYLSDVKHKMFAILKSGDKITVIISGYKLYSDLSLPVFCDRFNEVMSKMEEDRKQIESDFSKFMIKMSTVININDIDKDLKDIYDAVSKIPHSTKTTLQKHNVLDLILRILEKYDAMANGSFFDPKKDLED